LKAQNNNQICKPVETSIVTLKRIAKHSLKADDEKRKIGMVDSAGLEEEVVNILEQIPMERTPEKKPDVSYNNLTSDVSLPQEMTDDDVDPMHGLNQTDVTPLNDNDVTVILKILQGSKRHKWQDTTPETMTEILGSAEKMNKELTGMELNEISKYINIKVKKFGLVIRQNLRKGEKINAICSYVGHSSRVVVPIKRRRSKSIKSLKGLCIAELQKRSYAKEAIAVAYATCVWPCYKDKWFKTATIDPNITIEFRDCFGETTGSAEFSPVYSPEYMPDRNQLEFHVMDGTHIRTNVKSKLIRDGLENIRISAWKTVAATGETMLAPAMLEIQHDGKIMHQQSDSYVRTMFSRDVEDAMRSNGDLEEASFCRLFREWHEAEDKAVIPAQERCERSLRLRDWLMNSYGADRFPPPTQYIKGIPRITYEGLVCSIDAHILLYAVVKGGTYNWRSVSTLVAENFMGELAERSQNNHGVPSGNTLPSDMSKISELHAMRLKPDR
jgi:hypothetical protein